MTRAIWSIIKVHRAVVYPTDERQNALLMGGIELVVGAAEATYGAGPAASLVLGFSPISSRSLAR